MLWILFYTAGAPVGHYIAGVTQFSAQALDNGWSGNIIPNGREYTLQVQVAIPEPETYAMFIAGLGLMGFMARRRETA